MKPDFWMIFGAVWIYVTIGFALAVYYRRNDIADVQWGGGIFLASAVALTSSKHTIQSYLSG